MERIGKHCVPVDPEVHALKCCSVRLVDPYPAVIGVGTRAFYVSNKKSRKNSWGKGVLLATGYEIKQRPKWVMDIQARLYMASVDQGAELGRLEGTNFTIAVGFTLL